MPTPKSVRLDLTLYEKIEAYRAHLSNITGLQVNLSTDGVGQSWWVAAMAFMGGTIPFLVVSTYPAGIVQMADGTELSILEAAKPETGVTVAAVSYEDVGGLKEELRRVREMRAAAQAS